MGQCVCVCVCVCLSVCLSQAGVLSKRMNRFSSFFLPQRLSSAYPELCYKEIRETPKITALSFGKLWTQKKNSLWYVHRR